MATIQMLLQKTKKTDLMFAIEAGATESITQILETKIPGKLFGYYTVDLNATDENGKTALIYAVEKGNADAAQRIAFGKTRGFFGQYHTNVHIFDANGKTAMVYAVENGNLEIVRILLKALMPGKAGCCW
jgi:ankyrin repeat protein